MTYFREMSDSCSCPTCEKDYEFVEYAKEPKKKNKFQTVMVLSKDDRPTLKENVTDLAKKIKSLESEKNCLEATKKQLEKTVGVLKNALVDQVVKGEKKVIWRNYGVTEQYYPNVYINVESKEKNF